MNRERYGFGQLLIECESVQQMLGDITVRIEARLVDGADEVHRMVLSRELRSTGSEFWPWEVE